MIKLFQKQKIFFAKLCFLGHRHVQVLLVFDLDGDFPYNRYFREYSYQSLINWQSLTIYTFQEETVNEKNI